MVATSADLLLASNTPEEDEPSESDTLGCAEETLNERAFTNFTFVPVSCLTTLYTSPVVVVVASRPVAVSESGGSDRPTQPMTACYSTLYYCSRRFLAAVEAAQLGNRRSDCGLSFLGKRNSKTRWRATHSKTWWSSTT